MIPFSGLARQYQNIKKEILEETDYVYKTGKVLDGEFTFRFENAMAARCGRRFAVTVNSGTQALQFAQKVLLGSGRVNKVLIPTISFVATLNSVLMENNQPVFCDVDDQGLLDLSSMDFPLGWNDIDCIMYVNLFGNVVDYNLLKTISFFFNRKIQIIEDAAQSFGASYYDQPSGSLGDVSVLSFDPTKNLGNYGSGGITT
jgi:dTDP-4-amino-4,6-dideoxygalactose transaminase